MRKLSLKNICKSLLLFFIIYFFQNSVFAGRYSPQYQIMQMREEINQHFQKLPETTSVGDIYKTSLDKLYANDAISEKAGYSYLVDYFKKNYDGCKISEKDISNIYDSWKSIGTGVDVNSKSFEGAEIKGKDFVNSCKKLTKCVDKDLDNLSSDSEVNNTYTISSRENCISLVSDFMDLAKEDIDSLYSMKDENVGDDIFINGTTEDSNYDLLVDIKNIRKLLFKKQKDPKETIYYDMEGLDFRASLLSGEEDDNNNKGAYNNSGNLDSDNDYVEVFGENGNGLDKENSNIFSSDSKKSGSDGENFSKGQSFTDKNASDEIISGNRCVSDGNSKEYIGNQFSNGEEESQNLEKNLSGTELYRVINSIDEGDLADGVLSGKNFSSINQGNGLVGEDSSASAESCVASCSSFLCKMQCLCAAKQIWPERIYMKICLVPSGRETVIDTKPVMSIEEIVDEINTVLNNLKLSGKLMKHKKRDQFMETALQDIKLKNIFMFDIVTARKPVFEKNDKETEKLSKEDEWQNIQRLFGIKKGKLMSEDEKNKYITMWNSKKYEKQKGYTPDLNALKEGLSKVNTENVTNPEKIKNTYQSELIVKTKKEVDRFVNNNISFWEKTNTVLYKLNSLAEAFKKKIEKGANSY